MNIRGKALIIAAALGTVAQIILSLISSFVTPDPLQGLEGGGRLGSGLGGITWLICFLTIAVDVFVGVLYAFFHTREGPLSVGNGLLGGGLSAGAGRVVSSLGSIALSFLVRPQLGSMLSGLLGSDAFGDADVRGFAIAGGIIGGLLAVCLYLVVGGLFGGIGGLLGAATMKGEAKPPT